jgi:intracellular sulfur oxidation DsrE/DsrF family protein
MLKDGLHRDLKTAEKQESQGITLRACGNALKAKETAFIRKLPDVVRKEYVD